MNIEPLIFSGIAQIFFKIGLYLAVGSVGIGILYAIVNHILYKRKN